jgi:hypothetical protein
MAEVLLVVDSDDTGAAMLGAAFRRHGWRVKVLDLRFGRPTLDGSQAVPVVRLDGTPVAPDVVVNRSDTHRLGLPPATVLGAASPFGSAAADSGVIRAEGRVGARRRRGRRTCRCRASRCRR